MKFLEVINGREYILYMVVTPAKSKFSFLNKLHSFYMHTYGQKTHLNSRTYISLNNLVMAVYIIVLTSSLTFIQLS